MSDLYTVVPGSVFHVKQLSRTLRPAACATLRQFGADPRRALHRAFIGSRTVRTALLDGFPAAMWGTTGPALCDHAFVWVALSQQAVRWPLAIVRRAREELAGMSGGLRCLYATVAPDDERAMLFARSLGFAPSAQDYEIPGLSLLEFAGGHP